MILSYHLDLPMTASCCATARRPHEDPVLEASYDMNRAGGSRTVIASVSTQLAHGDWCGHSNLHEHHVENIDKKELIWVKLSLIPSSPKSFDDAKGLALQNFGQSWWGAEFKYWTSPKNHEIDGKFRMNHVCSMYINVPICTMGKYLMFIDVHGCWSKFPACFRQTRPWSWRPNALWSYKKLWKNNPRYGSGAKGLL